jgi:hypothetical protein
MMGLSWWCRWAALCLRSSRMELLMVNHVVAGEEPEENVGGGRLKPRKKKERDHVGGWEKDQDVGFFKKKEQCYTFSPQSIIILLLVT